MPSNAPTAGFFPCDDAEKKAPAIVADVFEMIDELRTEDITILLVEQNASRALSVADYGYVLEAGRLVVQGDPDELREEEAVRQAYLGH